MEKSNSDNADRGGADGAEGVRATIAELAQLTLDYARQETVDPLKDLGRFLRWGVPGMLAMGLGCLFLGLAALRALQTETGATLDGGWSFAPYVVVVAGAALVTGLVVSRISRGRPR